MQIVREHNGKEIREDIDVVIDDVKNGVEDHGFEHLDLYYNEIVKEQLEEKCFFTVSTIDGFNTSPHGFEVPILDSATVRIDVTNCKGIPQTISFPYNAEMVGGSFMYPNSMADDFSGYKSIEDVKLQLQDATWETVSVGGSLKRLIASYDFDNDIVEMELK